MKERRMYMRPKGRGFRVLWILLAMTAMPLLAAAWVAWGPGPAGDPGSAAFIGGSRYWRLLMADPAYQRLLALSALRVSVAAVEGHRKELRHRIDAADHQQDTEGQRHDPAASR